MSQASNVAHVEGRSCTLVLQAHSPYDRQMLREHVEMLAFSAPTLTLGMHGVRWTISRGRSAESRCSTCTQAVGRLRCRRDDDTVASCIDCAMRSEIDASEDWENS